MRTNVVLWWILTGFFWFVAAVYMIWAWLYYGHLEAVGSVALVFSGFMAAMVAFYLQLIQRTRGETVFPEDDNEAKIDDGDVELGEFSPWSWWPLVLASAVAVAAISLATAHFLIPLALGLVVVGLFGWVFEYYRGNFAR